MNKAWTTAGAVWVLAIATALLGQEGGQGPGGGTGGPPGGEGRGGMGPGRGGQMREMAVIFKTFKGLRDVVPALDEAQRAKFEEAMKKMTEKMKKAQEEFEGELSGILTAEQMEKYKTAKETPMEMGMGRRGPGGQNGRLPPQEGGAPQ